LVQASVTVEDENDEIVTPDLGLQEIASPSKSTEIVEASDLESKIKDIVQARAKTPEQVDRGYESDTVYYSPTEEDDVEGSRLFLIQMASRIQTFRYKSDKAKQAEVDSFLEAWKDNNNLTGYGKFKRNEGVKVEALAKKLMAAPAPKAVTLEDLQMNEKIFLGTLEKRQSELKDDIDYLDLTVSLLEEETDKETEQQVMALKELSKAHENKIALLKQAMKKATEVYHESKQDCKEALAKMENDCKIKLEAYTPKMQSLMFDRVKLQNQLDDCTRKITQLGVPADITTSNASKLPVTKTGDESSKKPEPSKGEQRQQ
jgi:hypothetical protein